jgi:hypothetical protein
MKNLIVPVANKGEKITFYLYQVVGSEDVLLAKTDDRNVVAASGSEGLLNILYVQDKDNTLVSKDVYEEEGKFILDVPSTKSDSGQVYRATGIYGPYYRSTSDRTDYDFRAIFLQDNQVLVEFSQKLKDDIHSKFVLSFLLLPVYCFLLCVVVGVILYFCVLKPIKELTKAAKGIEFLTYRC